MSRYHHLDLAIAECCKSGVHSRWEIENGHIKIYISKNGKERWVVTSKTPGDVRVALNTRAAVRRAIKELRCT